MGCRSGEAGFPDTVATGDLQCAVARQSALVVEDAADEVQINVIGLDARAGVDGEIAADLKIDIGGGEEVGGRGERAECAIDGESGAVLEIDLDAAGNIEGAGVDGRDGVQRIGEHDIPVGIELKGQGTDPSDGAVNVAAGIQAEVGRAEEAGDRDVIDPAQHAETAEGHIDGSADVEVSLGDKVQVLVSGGREDVITHDEAAGAEVVADSQIRGGDLVEFGGAEAELGDVLDSGDFHGAGAGGESEADVAGAGVNGRVDDHLVGKDEDARASGGDGAGDIVRQQGPHAAVAERVVVECFARARGEGDGCAAGGAHDGGEAIRRENVYIAIERGDFESGTSARFEQRTGDGDIATGGHFHEGLAAHVDTRDVRGWVADLDLATGIQGHAAAVGADAVRTRVKNLNVTAGTSCGELDVALRGDAFAGGAVYADVRRRVFQLHAEPAGDAGNEDARGGLAAQRIRAADVQSAAAGIADEDATAAGGGVGVHGGDKIVHRREERAGGCAHTLRPAPDVEIACGDGSTSAGAGDGAGVVAVRVEIDGAGGRGIRLAGAGEADAASRRVQEDALVVQRGDLIGEGNIARDGEGADAIHLHRRAGSDRDVAMRLQLEDDIAGRTADGGVEGDAARGVQEQRVRAAERGGNRDGGSDHDVHVRGEGVRRGDGDVARTECRDNVADIDVIRARGLDVNLRNWGRDRSCVGRVVVHGDARGIEEPGACASFRRGSVHLRAGDDRESDAPRGFDEAAVAAEIAALRLDDAADNALPFRPHDDTPAAARTRGIRLDARASLDGHLLCGV